MTPERFAVEVSGVSLEGSMLSGVAHVFGTQTLRAGTWIEMDRAAFERKLADPATDVRALYQHDPSMLLGRQGNGTVRLQLEGDEMPFEIDLPDTSYAADVKTLIDRKDLTGMSFSIVPGAVESFQGPDGRPGRRVTDLAEFVDISPVTFPAFDGTSLQKHSAIEGESLDSQLVMARHRVRTEVLA